MDALIVEFILKILILIILALSCYGIYIGLTEKAVFYMDLSDLFISFSGWIIMLLSVFVSALLEWDWVFKVGCVMSVLIAFYTAYKAYTYNMNNLYYAIPVGVAKILLGFLYAITWIDAVNPSGKTASQRTYNRRTSFIIIGLITPVLYKLVNGRNVYAKNEWPMP